MFDQMVTALGPLLENYGPLGVFLASVIEEVIAPIPSSAVVLLSGFLLVPQGTPFLEAIGLISLKVMLPASLGITLGSLFPYYLARLGEDVLIARGGKWLGIDKSLLRKTEKYFESHYADEIILFVTRCIPVIPSVVIGVFCGLVRIPLWEYLLYTFLGSLVRTFILGFIGFSVGAAYHQYSEKMSHVEDIVLVIIGVAILFGIGWWFRKRKR